MVYLLSTVPLGIFGWFIENAEPIAAVVGAVATIFLALLYRQQSRILETQRLPKIELVDRNVDGNELEVTLSNYGNGIGTSVRYFVAMAPLDADQVEPVSITRRARRVGMDSEKTLEQSIEPQQRKVTFRGAPGLAFRKDGKEIPCADFSTGLNKLQRMGVDRIAFQVYVLVDDQLGGCQSVRLFGFPQYPELSETDDLERLDFETAWGLGGGLKPVNVPDLEEPNCRSGLDPLSHRVLRKIWLRIV